jgi:hypothetical protein
MSAHDQPTDTALQRTNERSEGAAPVRVRLTAPPLSGVLRIVLLLVATALGLYLVWRIRGVIQLLAISLFLAFALFPRGRRGAGEDPSLAPSRSSPSR